MQDNKTNPLHGISRAGLTRRKSGAVGFTIVELMVVIVVIGILAGITALAYTGWRERAAQTEVKSDLNSAVSAMENIRNFGSGYSTDLPDNYNSSEGVDVRYVSGDSKSFCIEGQSKIRTSVVYFVKSGGGNEPVAGTCAGGAGSVPIPNNGGVVTALAGSTKGFADGTGSSAKFSGPKGVAVDTDGTIYVADYGNNRIRKITPAGVVTTLAGSTAGFADGPGSSAKFYHPTGVAVDTDGTVYVAGGNQRIRKITPSGVVTTFAGSGTKGFADGTGAAAQFADPNGIAVDSTGTVYVTDANNFRIRKITPSGVVTTLAGSGVPGFADGTGAAAKFYYSDGITVDASGMVYIADYGDQRIRKITPSGVVTTLAGLAAGFADGTGAEARFSSPHGVVVDNNGTVYVTDFSNHRIRKINPSGVVTTLAGSGVPGFAEGTGSDAQFNYPWGVAVDSAGTVYVADRSNNRIRMIK